MVVSIYLTDHEMHRYMKTPIQTWLQILFLYMELLNFLRPGRIRISVGTGTFAATMRECNVTIVSATINLGPPFNEIISFFQYFLPLITFFFLLNKISVVPLFT